MKRGLARTFQINTLFAGLTVLESVVLAILQRDGLAARWWRPVAGYRAQIDEAMALLAGLRLADDADTRTAQLPYGRQRLVEIALALATRPRILLLDEPAAGIPAAESAEVFACDRRAAQVGDHPLHRARHGARVPFRGAHHRARRRARSSPRARPPRSRRDERVRAVYLGREDG